MRRRDFLVVTALATGLGASGMGMPALASALAPDPFYGHEFPDSTGQQKSLTDYLGQPLVLNFWATWCPPCVKEMPDLQELHEKYPNIHIVGLAVDTASNVLKFGDKVSVSYPLLVAGHGGISLMRDLGNKTGGLPYTVIFDAQGRLAHRILGQINPTDLDALLAAMS
ncbi:MAG: TlpA family protein disulfide reductase [Burkholderiaceae bacterium]|nr:TlpA family protein disulfide reductase [Burkholderiaceae bacterium]